MKVQYFGDVNDYRKFALLRLLVEVGGFRVGVNWMLTPPDQTGQGANRKYLGDPAKWRGHDAEVFDTLAAVPTKPSKDDFRRVERDGLIPSASYFETCTPDDKVERQRWAEDCLVKFAESDLVFFDPDNGLEVTSKRLGGLNSNKYAFVDELAPHYAAGRTILLYQHFPRHISRAEVIANACDRFAATMPGVRTASLRSPFVAFLIASRPEHWSRIGDCFSEIRRRGWLSRFFDVCVSPYKETASVE